MDNLPFLIYAAGVADSLKIFIHVLSILAICLYIPVVLIGAGMSADYNNTSYGYAVNKLKVVPVVISIIILNLIGTFIPTAKTTYMIAGAIAGKELINSETGQKVVHLLNTKLDSLITEEINKNNEQGNNAQH